MPQLTVSMPAYNTNKYIKQAIESVFRQEDVDFELIVVDDGSADNTSEIVKSFNDPRITLIRNEKRRGIGYCHNLAIKNSKADFIIQVDSDDVVINKFAFKKSLNLLQSSNKIGQTHCYFAVINEAGRTTIDSFLRWYKILTNFITPDMNYKRELLINGSVMNGLRAYRKDIFNKVGLFNENLKIGEDWEMALRIIDKYEIRLIPEFLYAARIHKNNTCGNTRWQSLKFSLVSFSICKNLIKESKINYFKNNKNNIYWLLLLNLTFRLLALIGAPIPACLKNYIITSAKKYHLFKSIPWLCDYPSLKTKFNS